MAAPSSNGMGADPDGHEMLEVKAAPKKEWDWLNWIDDRGDKVALGASTNCNGKNRYIQSAAWRIVQQYTARVICMKRSIPIWVGQRSGLDKLVKISAGRKIGQRNVGLPQCLVSEL